MKDKVLEVVKKYNLIEEGDNIVLGLSGGPDSMALLYVLLDIKKIIDFNIYIAHLNHGVRGKEALEDQLFVEQLAKNLGLICYSKTVNMDEYAKKVGLSSEEAGRKLRYNFFREILDEIGGGKIAVAHNKNDQAETLLMRFFRGTGIDGLKGMEYISGDIIRPILGIERKEIERYLKERNIKTRIDKTNLEPIYNRNKIRLELIPYIEENFNPNIIDTLWRTSRICSIDSDFLEQYAQKIYNSMVKKKLKDSIILDGEKFVAEHESIQRRIIRNCILDIKGDLQGITEKHILDILTLFLERGTGKSINLVDNIIAKTSYDEFIIEKKDIIEHKKDFIYKLNMEGTTYIDEIGYSFNVKVLPVTDISKIDKNKRFIKYFDYDKIKGDLYVRNRKAGDRFVPYGMKGTKKIKDYFIDEKIPKDKRDNIPILTDDENILWIVGYRSSELYKITPHTKKVLVVSLNKEA
ncbi:tRNA(Ile)-lysidine synthase [Keratinibaculum paraultunense]|uniref:tRNA(Ile)-lysidine synthase n=1 Tax=Keratinibaculum paraultunense TaxID=1278232 RepID=A0A4R3KTW6_9FIRM|nr:tRNA lysidine(34) synthetase TilS [Keratinibaculum paraultunense]QQY79482.1 tRNA lysidine(34) synthetase TilS [Keratinibaculum paraultunense]TCS88023.1 tRNA(Ile)-lysidine synthase [Keratinibaculum paraultunense]